MNYEKIARLWTRGRKDQMSACIELAQSSASFPNSDKLNLVVLLKEDPRTIDRMWSAGSLYNRIEKSREDLAEKFYNNLYYSHFATVGDRFFAGEISLNNAVDWLDLATNEKLSSRQLSERLKPVHEPDFMERARKWFDKLDKDIINAESYGVEEQAYKKVREAAIIFKDALFELLEAEKAM